MGPRVGEPRHRRPPSTIQSQQFEGGHGCIVADVERTAIDALGVQREQ